MLSSIALTFAEANRYFNTELSTHFRAIDEEVLCLCYSSLHSLLAMVSFMP